MGVLLLSLAPVNQITLYMQAPGVAVVLCDGSGTISGVMLQKRRQFGSRSTNPIHGLVAGFYPVTALPDESSDVTVVVTREGPTVR